MGTQVKILKDGRYSIALEGELRDLLVLAISRRIHDHHPGLPIYLHCLLHEAFTALASADGNRVKLRRSEYFAVFDPAVMRYIDEPTQNIIREQVQLGPAQLNPYPKAI